MKGAFSMKKPDIAAYIWPSYTGDEYRSRIFWPNGEGEWETVREAKALFPGHTWPRKPLWGYVNEADSLVMECQIDAAVSHGVNVFIYDWYWYDHRPFLEQCLDNGFLKARNRQKMKFYLMWANHNADYTWDRRLSAQHLPTYVWTGQADLTDFRIIGRRWIEQYFRVPEYYRIDNKPVLAIYDMQNLIDGLGGIERTREAMLWLDEEVKKAGFDGIHYQMIKWGTVRVPTGVDGEQYYSPADLAKLLPFSSLTHYQFCHFTYTGRPYTEICEDVEKEWERIGNEFSIPYFPHVSAGWDNTPRFSDAAPYAVRENSPEAFRKMLEKAGTLASKSGVDLITVNSWNEWTETSYLEPDSLNGFGYLEAVADFCGGKRPAFQAHKGVSLTFPENTMAAFRAAAERGYDTIDLDLEITKDGKFVTLQDRMLNPTARTVDGRPIESSVRISDLTYEEALQYDFGLYFSESFRSEKLPLFTDVLRFAEENRIGLKISKTIQLFSDTDLDRFFELLRSSSAKICVSCWDLVIAERVIRELPQAEVAFDGIYEPDEIRTISEIVPYHRGVLWLPVDKESAPEKDDSCFVSEAKVQNIKPYFRLGLSDIKDMDRYREVLVRYRPDYIETNGMIRPEKN